MKSWTPLVGPPLFLVYDSTERPTHWPPSIRVIAYEFTGSRYRAWISS